MTGKADSSEMQLYEGFHIIKDTLHQADKTVRKQNMTEKLVEILEEILRFSHNH